MVYFTNEFYDSQGTEQFWCVIEMREKEFGKWKESKQQHNHKNL